MHETRGKAKALTRELNSLRVLLSDGNQKEEEKIYYYLQQ